MIGIYKITNKIDGKIYIGQSLNIEKRLKSHMNYSTNVHLRNAIKKYGKDNFLFEVLEETDVYSINERERYWIDVYKSTNPEKGYNLTNGGERVGGWRHTEETCQKLSEIAKKRASKPDYHNPMENTVIIHKGDVTSRVKKESLEEKLSEGWELGWSQESAKQGGLKRRGIGNGYYGKGYLSSGKNNPFYGKHHTEETKQKIKEHMPNMSHIWKGRHHTEESKQKMRGLRPSMTGDKNPNFGKRGKDSVMHGRKCINNGVIEKRVYEEDIPKYIEDGWVIGRLIVPYKKKSI